MAPSSFTIHNVKSPDRCDICHRSDQFDPQTGICERCKQLPIEELTNPEISSIYTIPHSIVASAIAATIICFCLSATFAVLNGTFGPSSSYLGRSREFLYGMLLLEMINLFTCVAVKNWCSDKYSERLDYRVIVTGTFFSSIGIIATLAGLLFSVARLIGII